MNDLGLNVAQVLDDNQDSYMNNEEYVRFSRVEEFQNKPKDAKFPLSQVTKAANNDDQGFAPYWGKGIVMNWTLVPVEEQKCHINWRQSINDDGSSLGHLASWQSQATSVGANMTSPVTNEAKTNLYLENQKDMDAKKETEELSEYIQSGISFCQNKVEAAKVNYQNARDSIKEAVGSGNDIDEIAVIAAATAKDSTDYKGIVTDYRNTANALKGNTNPAHIWTAMGTSVDIMKMYLENTLDDYITQKSGGKVPDNKVKVKKPAIEAPEIVEHSYQFAGDLTPLGQVEHITVHCTDGSQSSPDSNNVDNIHAYQKTVNDKKGIGYHFVIYADGTIHRGRPEDKQGAHVQSCNSNNLGISLVGKLDTEEPTDAQLKSLISLIAHLCQKYNIVPQRKKTIWGHHEWAWKDADNGDCTCPGALMTAKMDDVVRSVAEGSYSGGTKGRELWTTFVSKVASGLKLQGTVNISDLDFFPKICFLYVNLMNAAAGSSFDGPEWGFPFTEEQIKGFDQKGVDLTDGPFSGRNHEGVDLVPSVTQAGTAAAHDLNVEFSACKAGKVFIDGQWCNGIYIQHDDGTWSRYLHPKKHLVKHGDRVEKGQAIGIVGGHDGSNPTAYPWHLHLEMGNQIAGKTPMEKVHRDNCLINPVDQWKPTNGTDPVATNYKGWFLK